MQRPLADRMASMVQSDIRRYSAVCAAVGGVNLSQGVCDQPAPEAIKQAAKTAIDADRSIYTNLRGTAGLRARIADKLRSFNRIEADPETEIIVTLGAAGAFACAVMATLNPGDACVLFSPYYSYHAHVLTMLGVEVRFVDLRPPAWTYAREEVERAVTDRTRMIVVNTPSNPTGKVFSEAELADLVELARRQDLWLVTDEIYEYITFDAPHVSAASLPGAAERTITISGASKTYAVTGWRIGYAAGPAAVIEKMAVASDVFYICPPAPLQDGVEAGLSLPASYYSRMRDAYRAKRDLLAETLREVGFVPYVPAGAYYLLADLGALPYGDAREAAETILAEGGVATVPAMDFYRDPDEGRRQLRFCFAKRLSDLQEACTRLRRLAEARPPAGAGGPGPLTSKGA